MKIYAIVLGLNVVDVLMAIVIASVFRFGRKDGIVAELFKLFGVLCTIFITLHYYVHLANFLRSNFFGKDAVSEIFAFCLLGILLFLVFVFITKGWDMILRIKSFDVVDRWGNLVLSLVRCYFICSMIFLGLLISESGFTTKQAQSSLSWYLFRRPAVEFYRASHKAFVEKLFPGESINKKVFDYIEEKPTWRNENI